MFGGFTKDIVRRMTAAQVVDELTSIMVDRFQKFAGFSFDFRHGHYVILQLRSDISSPMP